MAIKATSSDRPYKVNKYGCFLTPTNDTPSVKFPVNAANVIIIHATSPIRLSITNFIKLYFSKFQLLMDLHFLKFRCTTTLPLLPSISKFSFILNRIWPYFLYCFLNTRTFNTAFFQGGQKICQFLLLIRRNLFCPTQKIGKNLLQSISSVAAPAFNNTVITSALSAGLSGKFSIAKPSGVNPK